MSPVSPSALLLASTSPARRQLMANAGLSFEIDPSGVDEDEVTRSLLAQRSSPQEIAEALAEMKALPVSSPRPGALVVAGDSTLARNGRLFDKPPHLPTARQQLP